jgi:hypothetical protein
VQDGDVRPSVKKYAKVRVARRKCAIRHPPHVSFAVSLTALFLKLEFRVGDVVYYLNDYGEKEGPFMVATVSGGKCTLCDLHGASAKGSRPVSLSSLEPQKRRR